MFFNFERYLFTVMFANANCVLCFGVRSGLARKPSRLSKSNLTRATFFFVILTIASSCLQAEFSSCRSLCLFLRSWIRLDLLGLGLAWSCCSSSWILVVALYSPSMIRWSRLRRFFAADHSLRHWIVGRSACTFCSELLS